MRSNVCLLKLFAFIKIKINNTSNNNISFGADSSYDDIKVLVNELKNVISKNLSIEQHSHITAESALKSIIIASMDLEE